MIAVVECSASKYLCTRLRPASPGTLTEEVCEYSPTARPDHFLRISVSQLGDTFVIVGQVVKNRVFDVFGNYPPHWDHSFIAVKSLGPNIDLPLRIEWS